MDGMRYRKMWRHLVLLAPPPPTQFTRHHVTSWLRMCENCCVFATTAKWNVTSLRQWCQRSQTYSKKSGERFTSTIWLIWRKPSASSAHTKLWQILYRCLYVSTKIIPNCNFCDFCNVSVLSGPLSPWHGASSGCKWRNGLQLWRVAANTLNKQSRTADRGWSSSLKFGRGANNSSPQKMLRNSLQSLEPRPILWYDPSSSRSRMRGGGHGLDWAGLG
jgi:hypothetical protein